MRTGRIAVKRRVWVGLVFAAMIIVASWSWTQRQLPGPAAPAAGNSQPFVRLNSAGTVANNQVLRERADLFDPTPLFFPTERNFGQQPLPDRLQPQAGQVFARFEPKLTVEDQNLKIYGAESARAPQRLADVLAQGNEAPFAGIGHVDAKQEPLPERAGFLEIRGFSGGNIIMEQALVGIPVPRPDYAPLEFIVAVGSGGAIGDPILASGSGWDDVDSFFRSYLVKTFRLGERLAPGSYRVLVGP